MAVRLSRAEIGTLDAYVADGSAASRSAALRLGVAYLDRRLRYQSERAVLAAHAVEGAEIYPDLAGLDRVGVEQA